MSLVSYAFLTYIPIHPGCSDPPLLTVLYEMWRKQSMATTHTAKTVRPICQSNNITCVTVAIFEFASRTGSSSSSSLPLLPQLRFPDRLNFLFTSVMIPNSFYTKSIRHFVLLRRCLCYHIYIILPCPGPGLRPVIYYNMYFP